jgi:membrane-bound lytic murein transglycosylase D
VKAEDRYDSLFQFYGQRWAVPWILLKAQAIAESNLDPDAVSHVGATGLTQFMAATWAEVTASWRTKSGKRKPWSRVNAEASIRAQAQYMAGLLSRFPTEAAALAAYNWGPGRVARMLRRHDDLDRDKLPKETRNYIQRVGELQITLQSELQGEKIA